MKKIIVVAAAAIAIGAFAQDQDKTENGSSSQSWRLTVGGFGRGSMTMRPADMPGGRFEMYGVDADAQFNAYETEKFNLWTGVGFGWAPNQNVYKKSETRTLPGATAVNSEKNDLQYGEVRLMAVPEWKATDSLAFGLRLGAAFDWTRCKNHWDGSVTIPLVGTFGDSGADTYTQFLVQGIAGLQGTYMFTDNFGLYAAVDWRGGGEHMLKKNHENYGKLDMDGWYASCGAVFAF